MMLVENLMHFLQVRFATLQTVPLAIGSYSPLCEISIKGRATLWVFCGTVD